MMVLFFFLLIFLCPLSGYSASNPDITVEWMPNSDHQSTNTEREGRSVYSFTINGNPRAHSVGARIVLWVPPGIDCESLYDSVYGPGEKVLHLFLTGQYAQAECRDHLYAHYDVHGGVCRNNKRVEWDVRLPVVLLPGMAHPVAQPFWFGSKFAALRGTDAHFSLLQVWPNAGGSTISSVIGGQAPGLSTWVEPMWMDCRDVFP